MVAFTPVPQFVEDVAKGVHNFGTDTLTIALVAAANLPISADAVLADLTEVAYTYCSSRALTTTSADQTAGLLKVIIEDLTLTATGGAVGPFQGIVIYNDTPAVAPIDPLIGWYDLGSEVTLSDGQSFFCDFDQVNGLFDFAFVAP